MTGQPIEIAFADGKRQFETLQDAIDFAKRTLNQYAWLNNSDASFEGLRNNHLAHVNRLQKHIARCEQEPNPSHTEGLVQQLTHVHTALRLPTTESGVGELITKLRSEIGDFAAGAALALYVGQAFGSNTLESQRGRFALWAHLAGLDVIAAQASLNALRNANTEAQVFAKEQRASLVDQKQGFRDLLERAEQLEKIVRRWAPSRLARFERSASKRFEDAIASLKAVEAGYRAQMGLQAPVEYWKKKGSGHKTQARRLQKWAIGYAVVAGGVLILFLIVLANRASMMSSATATSPAILIQATLGVVVSTMLFWAGRLIVRMFLSEHHLGIDAEERAVMVETYLALTTDGKISDDDRKLVLLPLFRPTADGIIKDDAAPEMSPASLLAKNLTK